MKDSKVSFASDLQTKLKKMKKGSAATCQGNIIYFVGQSF